MTVSKPVLLALMLTSLTAFLVMAALARDDLLLLVSRLALVLAVMLCAVEIGRRAVGVPPVLPGLIVVGLPLVGFAGFDVMETLIEEGVEAFRGTRMAGLPPWGTRLWVGIMLWVTLVTTVFALLAPGQVREAWAEQSTKRN